MISLTENAAVKVKELILKRPSETDGLRVGGVAAAVQASPTFLNLQKQPTMVTES